LEEVARDHGLSREQIRKVTERVAPWRPWQALAAEKRAQRASVRRVVAADSAPCRLCGAPVGERRSYCSVRHREAYAALRYHIDAHRRLDHRLVAARWVVDHAADLPGWRVTHARRVLNEQAREPQHRGLRAGSLAWRTVRQALRSGWPIARNIPNHIREQVEVPTSDETVGRDR
jgi:hypothetical protein